jgi:predicted nucleic acid-binding protein
VKPKLYIETTVVSYLTARPTRDLIMTARQQITTGWWAARLTDFDCVISQLVLDEAGRGDHAAALRLTALKPFHLLDINDDVTQLAERLIEEEALPANALDDAGHVAVCAVHGVKFLLTWNFRHLANAEKLDHIRQVCLLAGFFPSTICTPEELMKGNP